MPAPESRARLDRMPGSDIPVIRQPFAEGDALPYRALGSFTGSHLYDLGEDPGEKRAAERLRSTLLDVEAAEDRLVRLGLS